MSNLGKADNVVTTEEEIHILYEMYSNDVYRFARLTTGDASAAKDVVQEVFLRAFRAWDSFRKDANARTWLMSIARNYLYDSLRKQRTERKVLSNYARSDLVRDSSSAVETKIMLESALARMKDTYRQVFVLRHIQNYSVQETAQIMGWSESNVKTTDQRAIAKLRTILNSDDLEVKKYQ